MKSEPVEIPRVAGPVTVERTLRRVRICVDGAEVPNKRRVFFLPATMGLPVQAKLKYPGDPLPALEVGDVVYQFGPHNPRLLWLPVWLPMLWVGVGWVGVFTALIGWATNLAVMSQTTLSTVKKAAATLAVIAATIPIAGVFGVTVQDWYREVSGIEPLSPRVVGFGDCVDTRGTSEVQVELERITDCATPHDGEVVFTGTHGSSSATYAQRLGPVGWCREGGKARLSTPIVAAPYQVRIATDGDDLDDPKAGDTWACVAELEDGEQLTGPFSCADLSAANDPRCRQP